MLDFSPLVAVLAFDFTLVFISCVMKVAGSLISFSQMPNYQSASPPALPPPSH